MTITLGTRRLQSQKKEERPIRVQNTSASIRGWIYFGCVFSDLLSRGYTSHNQTFA
jgi:hypothetical protein